MKKPVIIAVILLVIVALGALVWFGGVKGGWFKSWFGHTADAMKSPALGIVPGDAFWAAPVDVASIAAKIDLSHRTPAHPNDPMLACLDDPLAAGLDVRNWWFGFGRIEDRQAVIGLAVPLADAHKFAAFGKYKDVKPATRCTFSILDQKQQWTRLIAWDEHRALALWVFADSLRRLSPETTLDRLFDPAATHLSDNPSFSGFLGNTSDIGSWMNTAKMDWKRMLPEEERRRMPKIGATEKWMETENIITGSLTFDKGAITMKSEVQYSPEARKMLEDYLGRQPGRIDGRLFDYLPGDNVIALYGVSVNLPQILARLEADVKSDSLVGKQIENTLDGVELLGLERDDLFHLFKGDFALTLNGSAADPKHPRIILAALLERPQVMIQVTELLTKYGLVKPQGRYWKLAGSGEQSRLAYTVQGQVLYLSINSSFAVEDAANGRKPIIPINAGLVKRATAVPIYMHLDLAAACDLGAAINSHPDTPDTKRLAAELTRARRTFSAVDAWGTLQEVQGELITMNPNENSLKFILQQYSEPVKK
jgi:hypothetical protein